MEYTIYAHLLLNDGDVSSLHFNVDTVLGAIGKWIKSNNSNLNVSKTNYIVFQNRSIKVDFPPVTLEGAVLQRVTRTKFLGVYIDENINWNNQITFVATKLSKMSGILYRIRENLTREALISVYYTLCFPHLIYCVSVWACTWPSFLKKITVAQNNILRCLFYMNKFDSTQPIFSTQKFLTFENIHKYFLLLFIYKYIKQDHDSQLFRLVNTSHNTRSNTVNLICPQFSTSLFNNSVLCFGPSLWNSLTTDIKSLVNSGTLSLFKRHVKTHLFNLQTVDVENM